MFRSTLSVLLFCLGASACAQSNHHPASQDPNPFDDSQMASIALPPMLIGPAYSEAAPPKQAEGPLRISGGVMAGMILTRVDPVYPPEARSKGLQGSVVLSARIGKDGTVQDLSLISGPAPLGEAALDAVRQWTYKPFLLNGEPREVNTTVTVNFQSHASSPSISH